MTRHMPSFGRRHFSGIGVGLGATLVILLAAFTWLLWTARVAERDKASAAAANLCLALTHDLARNIELYDLSIQNVVDGLAKPDVMAASPALRQMILFDRAATAQFLGSIFVVDERGDVVVDSLSVTPRPFNYADRDYFQAQAARADLGLYVSRPVRSKTNGMWIIGLSRRYDKADGTFGGVVVGTLGLDYISGMFERLKLGPDSMLALYRRDGTLLMRKPYDSAQIGQVKDFRHDLGQGPGEGEYESVGAIDGVTRLYHFQEIPGLPLLQFVGLSTATIYAEWWRKAELTGAILLVCAGMIAALGAFLMRELQRRTCAEAALLAMADQDGLTGLANRRRLDRALDAEWRRAVRTGLCLSVLMIDADHFKSYNDTYGHLAGDGLIQAIARAVGENVKRPGDLAARYGGEEFMVLLPAMDLAGACTIAEAIRASVIALSATHATTACRIATVSIGVATARPAPGQQVAHLVAAADMALYQAKAAGRNRVELMSGRLAAVISAAA